MLRPSPSFRTAAVGLAVAAAALTALPIAGVEASAPVPGHGDAVRGDPDRGDATDSMLVVSGQEHALVMQDPDTGARRAFFRVGQSPNAVAVAPDGRTAVVTNQGERVSGTTVCVVDLYATNLVRTIPLVFESRKHGVVRETRAFHRPSGVTFVQGSKRALVSCSIEGALLSIDLTDGRVVGVVELEASDCHDVVVDHGGEFAYVANRGSGSVSVVDVGRMSLVGTVEAGGGPHGMALHPTANEVWVTNVETNSISIIDLETRDECTEFACGAMPVDVTFTTDGKYALVANMQEGNVSIIDAETRQVTKLVELDRVSEVQAKLRPVGMKGHFGKSPLPTQIMVEPDGRFAYVSTRRDDTIHEIDLETAQVTRRIEAPIAPTCLSWSRVPDDAGKSASLVKGRPLR